jgi:peptidyl-prolyl cis-trans isomerase SurA
MKFILLCLTFICILPSLSNAAGTEGIAIVVNQDAITTSDIQDRMRLIAGATGLSMTEDTASKLRPQITNVLIDEALKLQEGKRLDIKVTDEEIQKAFAAIAGQNNIPPEQFKKILKSQGVNLETLYDQIRSQIIWGKIVQRRIRPKVEVMETDIDAELNQLKRNIGQTQYRLGEIFIPLTDRKKEQAARQFVTGLVEELRKRPDAFPKAARQFSQTREAANGGDIGFITLESLPKELRSIVPILKPKEISSPIKTMNGFHILTLIETRNVTEKDLPSRELILQKIGNEQLERGARRYLQDLSSSAFIEKRI